MSDEFIWPTLSESILGDKESFKWDATNWNQGPFLALGFIDAGDAIVSAFIESRGSNRSLLYPALFCYRHHLELKIKYICNGVSEYSGRGEFHLSGHDVGMLWSRMESFLVEIIGGDLFPDSQEKLLFDQAKAKVMELCGRDPKGERYRYSRTKGNVEISDTVKVSPRALREGIRDVSEYLDSLYDFCTNGEGNGNPNL